MGGKSFTKPGKRLTTPQLQQVTKYCRERLASFFPRIECLRHVESKTDHGDVDLLCSFESQDFEIKHSDIGLFSPFVQHPQSVDEIIQSDEPRLRKVVDELSNDIADLRIGGVEAGESESVRNRKENQRQIQTFCDEISRAIEGKQWIVAFYSYPIIAVEIPCSVFEIQGIEEDDFYQVDIALVPPPSFDAYYFNCSYNILFAILVISIQALSPSIWLRRDKIILRHRPFSQLPFIEITLFDNWIEGYKWLGLDLTEHYKVGEGWMKSFEDYEDIYNWLIGCKEGSLLIKGLEMIRDGEFDVTGVDYKRFHTRENGIREFVEWLSKNLMTAPVSPKLSIDDEVQEMYFTEDSDRTLVENQQGAKTVKAGGEMERVEYPKPISLDDFTLRTLKNVSKEVDYLEILNDRQGVSNKIFQSQLKRAENRRKAKEIEEKRFSNEQGAGADP